jgi:hypothetical protein
MDNLADILARKNFDEPQEVGIIKRYVEEHFDVTVGVKVQEKIIVITARSAPLVGRLRMHTVQLQRACQTDKKFIFRIG